MKAMLATILTTLTLVAPAFANDRVNCATAAELAVAKLAAGPSQKRVQNMSASAQLIKKSGQVLLYNVEVFEQYAEGGSTVEFPSQYYSVAAKGNDNECKITAIQLQK
jgi:hypothetical protein